LSSDPSLPDRFGGFLTEEIREKGERRGFKIVSIPERQEGILARKGFTSPYRLGSYGVNISDLDRIGVSSIERGLISGKIIVIDEIGKMELFSEKFKNVLFKALDSPQKVLATIMERSHRFTDMIKRRKDVRLVHLSRDNFEDVFREVLKWLQ
jgi:nucleoside-triphosphatase